MSEQSARLYQRRPNYMTNLYSMWRLPHRRTEARFPEASKIKCSVNGNVHCSQTKTMHRNYQRKKKNHRCWQWPWTFYVHSYLPVLEKDNLNSSSHLSTSRCTGHILPFTPDQASESLTSTQHLATLSYYYLEYQFLSPGAGAHTCNSTLRSWNKWTVTSSKAV